MGVKDFIVEKVIGRLKEPSTYAALTGVLTYFGITIPEGIVNPIAALGVGIAGLLGFFLTEKKAKEELPWKNDQK